MSLKHPNEMTVAELVAWLSGCAAAEKCVAVVIPTPALARLLDEHIELQAEVEALRWREGAE